MAGLETTTPALVKQPACASELQLSIPASVLRRWVFCDDARSRHQFVGALLVHCNLQLRLARCN